MIIPIKNVRSNNMTPWILALLIIPAIRFFSKEKPLNSSYGILKYGDSYFMSWSERLMRVTILERNRLTSSKEKCSSALDTLFGNCLHIKNMENDAATLQNLADLTPFHMLCYTLVRRWLEIVSLYLVRWLPLGSLFGLLSSSCALVWIYLKNKWNPQKAKMSAKGVLQSFLTMPSLLILLTFLFFAAICLSVMVPFGKELVSGDSSSNQFIGFFKDLNRSLIEKIFFQNNSCSTVYDLFYFGCLRKTLFDLEKSRMTPSVPLSTEERLLLKLQFSLMDTTLFLLSSLMHLAIMLFFCVVCRMTIRHLEAVVTAVTTQSRIVSSNRRRIAQNRNSSRWMDETQVGLGPSLQRQDNRTPSEDRQSNSSSSRPVIGKVKEAPTCCNSSRMSVKKAEGMKPSVRSTDIHVYMVKEPQPIRKSSEVSVAKAEVMKQSDPCVCMVKKTQPSRNPSRVSVTKSEVVKPSVKLSGPGLPSVNGQQKSPIEHADVGTYVCFDTEGSSDEAGFEFVDF